MVARQRPPRQGAGGQAGLGGCPLCPLLSHPGGGCGRPLASSWAPSTSSEGGRGSGGGTSSWAVGSCWDPPGLPAEVPLALETHLRGCCRHGCRPRCGASESGAAGDGPAPGSHHRDTGEEYPALPGPGHSGPGFPGHGGPGARQGVGSQGGPLPICPAVCLPAPTESSTRVPRPGVIGMAVIPAPMMGRARNSRWYQAMGQPRPGGWGSVLSWATNPSSNRLLLGWAPLSPPIPQGPIPIPPACREIITQSWKGGRYKSPRSKQGSASGATGEV